MNDKQIQDIADRVIEALNHLAPASGWTITTIVAAAAPAAALLAASLVTWIGWRNLKHQQRALDESMKSDAASLDQKRQADGRSEWWRRTQWALAASTSEDTRMYAYGTGILDRLSESDLATPEDKALLDAVWQGSSTAMQDDSIDDLIAAARSLPNLTEEEIALLRSFDNNVDSGPVVNENEPRKEEADD